LAWHDSAAALKMVLVCGHSHYIRWGTYPRKPRPDGFEIRIQRFFCLVCRHTCSVLPAFLLGHVHYTATTVAPYVDYLAAHEPASIAEAWAHALADGFPLDLATLYRWFKRLAFRLTFLLAMIEKELLELAPEADLASLEKFIIKRTAIRGRWPESPQDTTRTTTSGLTLHALCQSNSRLAGHLLRTTGKLRRLSQDPAGARSPLLFLNFFCCQKTGQALLSPVPLPRASRPP